MTPREFQEFRDGLVMDGLIFEKSVNLSDTLVEMDMTYPFDDSEVSLDSIGGENHKKTWIEINKMAKKLSSKLSDQVHADDNTFAMHQGFKVVGQGKGEAVKYLPFTLEFDDGQVLTALAKNVKDLKTLKPNQDLMVTHFMLNKKDITHAIYKNGDTSIDVAQTVARLKTVIEATHRKFIAKNPIPNSSKEANSLREDIRAINIDFSNVVEEEAPKQTHAEWEGEITAGLETELNITTSDAQGIVEAQNFLLKQSWAGGDNAETVVAKIVALQEEPEPEPEKLGFVQIILSKPHTISEDGEVLTADDGKKYQITEDYHGEEGITDLTLIEDEPKPEVEPEVEPAVTEEPKTLSIKAKLKAIKPFMNKSQYKIISTGMDKEDYEFNDVINRLHETITTMPKTYEQDGKGNDAVAHLHYFNSGSDWHITEKDMGDEQVQAFGYAILNGDTQNAELGYISIEELVSRGVELDFHYAPETLGKIKGEKSYAEKIEDMEERKVGTPIESANIVDDVNNGVIINGNFIEWQGIKSDEDQKEWEAKTSALRFGTYEDKTILDIIDAFNPKKGDMLNAYKREIRNALEKKEEVGDNLAQFQEDAKAKGLDLMKEGAGYALSIRQNAVLSVHIARFNTLEEVSKFLGEFDMKFYDENKGQYNMAQHESEQYSEEVDRSLLIDATTADEFESKLDELVENLENLGELEKYEDELNALADQLTELMKSENA